MEEQKVSMMTVSDNRPSSRRARIVDEKELAKEAVASARKMNCPALFVEHGGGVANSYGYPARTDAVAVLALPTGRAYVWATRLTANKVTLSGAACACIGRRLYDGRWTPGKNAIEKSKAIIALLEEVSEK